MLRHAVISTNLEVHTTKTKIKSKLRFTVLVFVAQVSFFRNSLAFLPIFMCDYYSEVLPKQHLDRPGQKLNPNSIIQYTWKHKCYMNIFMCVYYICRSTYGHVYMRASSESLRNVLHLHRHYGTVPHASLSLTIFSSASFFCTSASTLFCSKQCGGEWRK